VFHEGGEGAVTPAAVTPAAVTPADQPWNHALPEDVRVDPSVAKYDSFEALARGTIAQQKLIGRDPASLIEMPAAGDAAAQLTIMRKLGAPEEASGYKLTAVEGTAESVGPTSDIAQLFLKHGVAAGLLPSQAQQIYAGFATDLTASLKDDAASAEADASAGVATLKADWGQAYDQNVAAARHGRDQVAKAAGVDEQALRDTFEQLGLANDPMMAKVFAHIGKMMGEDSAGGQGAPGGFNQILSPAEATARGEALLMQSMNADGIAEKRQLGAEATKFFQMAHPEG
jgi:hypothetical protein